MCTSPVRCEWDEAKRKANIPKHGIDFLDVPEMFGSLMLVGTDNRKDHGETRKIVLVTRPGSTPFFRPAWKRTKDEARAADYPSCLQN